MWCPSNYSLTRTSCIDRVLKIRSLIRGSSKICYVIFSMDRRFELEEWSSPRHELRTSCHVRDWSDTGRTAPQCERVHRPCPRQGSAASIRTHPRGTVPLWDLVCGARSDQAES